MRGASDTFKNKAERSEEKHDSLTAYPTPSASNQSFGFGEMGNSLLTHPKLYAPAQNGFCCGDPILGIMKDSNSSQTNAGQCGGGCDTAIGPSDRKVELNLDKCGCMSTWKQQ